MREHRKAEHSKTERGAMIVVRDWLRLKPWEKLLIVTSENHIAEAEILRKCAHRRSKAVDLMVVEKRGKHVGVFFDSHEDVFDGYQAVLGATDYSLVTTKAAKRAIQRGGKFLSLPLSTNNGKSMLAFQFMMMDTKKSKMMAGIIMKYLNSSSVVHVTTRLGTDLTMYKRNRPAGFFNGVVRDGKGFSSASIEVYVPIEETKTKGILIPDGSLGYIGRVDEPFRIRLEDGYIREIERTAVGRKLKEYMDDFHDPGIYAASELGIGLNSYAKCRGDSYIEDESAYGTFHIGVGRNIALGGVHEANGHFDIVAKRPDIYADNRKIMERGKIIIPEPVFF
ncbi:MULTISPECIES: peptidase [Clostridia]|jgi:leucyl aminopeptidase (aminopeptidase T)|uniref:peptidase n=1 Tax=Clostridia TaxID=186801 RepID=UPI001FAB0B99|nr:MULTISPECIES: peptidase [Clostridia]